MLYIGVVLIIFGLYISDIASVNEVSGDGFCVFRLVLGVFIVVIGVFFILNFIIYV